MGLALCLAYHTFRTEKNDYRYRDVLKTDTDPALVAELTLRCTGIVATFGSAAWKLYEPAARRSVVSRWGIADGAVLMVIAELSFRRECDLGQAACRRTRQYRVDTAAPRQQCASGVYCFVSSMLPGVIDGDRQPEAGREPGRAEREAV